MKVNRTKLLEALKAVQPGLASNDEVIAHSSSFVFGKGRVFTYNDEVAVSHPIDIDLEGAVPGKEFYGIINKVKGEQIDISIDKGTLLVKSSGRAGLRLEPNATLPLEELGMPEEWIDLPEEFCKAVRFCLFSASKDQSKGVLTYLHIFDNFVESCDNYRITRYDLGNTKDDKFPDEMLLPAYAAKDITANKPVEYAKTSGWLHFRNEAGVTFSCRSMEDEYPDFTPYLKSGGDPVTFPENLDGVMDRANVLSDEDRITIILEKDEIIVTTENSAGWFEESVKAEYKGDPVEFDIQPEFMKSILKFKGESYIDGKMLMFDNDDFVHVVKLMVPKKK